MNKKMDEMTQAEIQEEIDLQRDLLVILDDFIKRSHKRLARLEEALAQQQRQSAAN